MIPEAGVNVLFLLSYRPFIWCNSPRLRAGDSKKTLSRLAEFSAASVALVGLERVHGFEPSAAKRSFSPLEGVRPLRFDSPRKMAVEAGFEPATFGVKDRCSTD